MCNLGEYYELKENFRRGAWNTGGLGVTTRWQYRGEPPCTVQITLVPEIVIMFKNQPDYQ